MLEGIFDCERVFANKKYHYYKKYKDLSFLMWLFNQHSAEQALKFIGEAENMNLRFREGVGL